MLSGIAGHILAGKHSASIWYMVCVCVQLVCCRRLSPENHDTYYCFYFALVLFWFWSSSAFGPIPGRLSDATGTDCAPANQWFVLVREIGIQWVSKTVWDDACLCGAWQPIFSVFPSVVCRARYYLILIYFFGTWL